MEPTPTVHLRAYSEYSLREGVASPTALAKRAADLGQPALALTDRGVMSGVIEHYTACRAEGIKPVIGCELTIAPDMHAVTLLAATDNGYRNLVKLSSVGFLDGKRDGTTSLTIDQLDRHSGGLIALTTGPHAADLRRIFGTDNLYLALRPPGLPEHDQANEQAVETAESLGIRLVASGEVRYLDREDHRTYLALECLRSGSTLADPNPSLPEVGYHLRTTDEMAQAFARWPEALAATREIADRCDVELEFGASLEPRFLLGGQKADADRYLRDRVDEGLRSRFGDSVPASAIERIEHELGVIADLGAADIFLIVWDIVCWAKEQDIAVGPGRGSMGGSLVCFALAITDVDPLAHDLLFERFIDPKGTALPCIDIDFSVGGRRPVLEYMRRRYGADSVAQAVTFTRANPRDAICDAARVLGKDEADGNRLALLVPDPEFGHGLPLLWQLLEGEPLRDACEEDDEARQIVELALELEGIRRNRSIHASTVVVADRPLTDFVPLQVVEASEPDAEGNPAYRLVAQYPTRTLEEIGLLQLNLLGLRSLDTIEDTLNTIERTSGSRPDLAAIPDDDAAAYELLVGDDTLGVFQFESQGMRECLRQVAPIEFGDLVALTSMYRPGAMHLIAEYAQRKHDPDSIEFADERLRPILAPTYGLVLYQEQAMQISKELAGFTEAQASDLRKALGKKNRHAMGKLEPLFREGCSRRGVATNIVDWLWATNEKSAEYSFNKSHAVAYALISYRSAWLKANYPVEFMAVLLNSVSDSEDKLNHFVLRCEGTGIGILLPDGGEEDAFTVESGAIRLPATVPPSVIHAVEVRRRFREVRDALWQRAEHRLAGLPQVSDGSSVLVGGLLTRARKIKTRAGATLMFAELDDFEGQVELIFFDNEREAYERVAVVDETVLVRGRLSNDERGVTVKVQTCERFAP